MNGVKFGIVFIKRKMNPLLAMLWILLAVRYAFYRV